MIGRKITCRLLTLAGAGIMCTAPLPAAPQNHVSAAASVPSRDVWHNVSVPMPRHVSVPMPRPRPPEFDSTTADVRTDIMRRGTASAGGNATLKPLSRPASGPFALASSSEISPADIAAVKRVIEDARAGRQADADATEKSIADPLAGKLAEWIILRSDNTNPGFQRYAAFIRAYPAWPDVALFRRRAEHALWNDRLDDDTVRTFFAAHAPTTAKGRFVLARALLAQGNRSGAAALVRYGWRQESFSADVEKRVLATFGGLLGHADHKMRMEHHLYSGDIQTAMRAAQRLGGSDLLIASARAAVIRKARNAKAFLDAVPVSARHEAGYIFARINWLRKHGKSDEASQVMLSAPADPDIIVDPDQWWIERRVLVRDLLDENKPKIAYRIARDAATPKRGNYRADQHFTAGWIALRFLNDPATAAKHFARIVQGTNNPFALSRGGYWQGRAAQALHRDEQAKHFYAAAARYSTTYYGQLARARLGLTDLGLRRAPSLTPQQRSVLNNVEIVRAARILYSLHERELLASMFADLGQSGNDIAGMAELAELAGTHVHPYAMVLLCRAAFNRGLPLDYYAYPAVGLPDYKPITVAIPQAVAYSIARQESQFNQNVVSPAHAMGLMQVTPAAALDTAKRFHASYSRKRLLNDPVYNMQMGAAELSRLLANYNGSYLLTFAGYNAGPGRVTQWIASHGDPRDPSVDPVDWVERIPISETRNYVQRILENLQVYRARFGDSNKLLIEADLKRGSLN